ncbi:MAG: hypothetical protein D6826_02930 [Alphaproteobacteria bacterium]|nr:MAG: hypothetical protein D6826_02930 [Alphaproteobacteria bacterium]
MIALFTDFGPAGPYVGQMRAVLAREARGVPVIDLMCDAPAFDPRAAAYLLAALVPEMPPATVVLGVVDPGVGGARQPLIVAAGAHWFVGPDNGLFAIAARRAAAAGQDVRAWRIDWRPARLSATFHGRDLFAPVAARLACGRPPPGAPCDGTAMQGWAGGDEWPDDLDRIIYVDAYGNAMTGRRAATVAPGARLHVAGTVLSRARTFADVPPGTAFWYENSIGLVEVAVHRGSAAAALGLRIGTPVRMVPAPVR